MAERYSIVGVYPDGRRTTLLANASKDDATLIAIGMEQGCTEFVRIDVVAETPRDQMRRSPSDRGRWTLGSDPERLGS